MVSSSAAQLQSKIDSIDTAIDALITDPNEMVGYGQGGKTVSKNQKLDGLLRLREHYLRALMLIPSEAIEDFDISITAEGEDQTDYIEPDVA